MPPSTIILDNIVAVLRRSPATVEHQDHHHVVVLTELLPDALLDRSPGERHRTVRVSRTRRRRSNGVWIGRIGRRTYDYFLYVVSTLPLRFTRVRRQHSPLSLLCITMILRVRRIFFEITMFPNKKVCEVVLRQALAYMVANIRKREREEKAKHGRESMINK